MSDVRFIRKNGRIIPIKRKDSQANGQPEKNRTFKAATGAAQVAGGLIVSKYAGKFAAHTLRDAATFSNQAQEAAKEATKIINKTKSALKKVPKEQLSLAINDVPLLKPKKIRLLSSLKHQTLGASVMSEKLFRSRLPIRALGSAVSGALIGAGVASAYEAIKGKKLDTKEKTLATVSSAAGAVLTHQSYYKNLGATLRGSFSHAFRFLKMAKIK